MAIFSIIFCLPFLNIATRSERLSVSVFVVVICQNEFLLHSSFSFFLSAYDMFTGIC